MITKKFLNKIEINKYTFILLFLSLITGLFKEILIVFTILFFHEMGHVLISQIYHWKIKKIIFYPFGGLTLYEEEIDKPLNEELIITLFGPIFQIIFFYFISYLYKKYFISDYIFNIFKNYHYSILLFNLLPILPLDGAKILNIIFNKFLNYRKAYYFTSYFSLIVLLIFIFFHFNFSYIIIISFLINELFLTFKNKKYIFNKFLLEKSLYKNNYKKYKKVNSYKKMYRNKKNLIKKNNIYLTEHQFMKYK